MQNYCTYFFDKQAKFFILPIKSIFIVKGALGFYVVHLPSYYFYRQRPGEISFMFLKKFFFFSFLKHLSYYYNRLFNFYFFKIRSKGLGYKVKRYGKHLIRFYFTMVDYLYFHVPSNVLFKQRKRRLLLISNDPGVLRNLAVHLLLAKRHGAYNKRGFWYTKKIIILRKRRKI